MKTPWQERSKTVAGTGKTTQKNAPHEDVYTDTSGKENVEKPAQAQKKGRSGRWEKGDLMN